MSWFRSSTTAAAVTAAGAFVVAAAALWWPSPSRPARHRAAGVVSVPAPADRAAEARRVIAAVERVVPVVPVPAADAPPPADPVRGVWDRLADCESGDWDGNGRPVPGSARWDYGITFDHGDRFEGGLNFAPSTWDAYRGSSLPSHAGRATRAQQIAVAERVLADQGWRAWPVCSRKLGLR